MKYSLRTLSIIVALGLLVAVFGLSTAGPTQAADTVADNTVEWMSADGSFISHVTHNTTTVFYINDTLDKLQGSANGTSTWLSAPAVTGGFGAGSFNIATGNVASTTPNAFTTATSTLLFDTTTPYNSGTPADTPLVADSLSVSVAGNAGASTAFVTVATGQFALNSTIGSGLDVIATFKYNILDTHGTTTVTERRALVTSNSDTVGEYVVISEVTAVGSSATSSNSDIFRGSLTLTDQPSKATNQDGELWVRDGDSLTVTFLDTDGVTALDTDTVVVDTVAPAIGSISPAFGLITANVSPILSFEVTDSVAQVRDVQLLIGSDPSTSTVTSFNTVSITNGTRYTTAITTAWLSTFAGMTDGTFFRLEIVATDKAGNTARTSDAKGMNIDTNGPTITAANTGDANTAITVTFNEDLDSSSVLSNGSNFSVDIAGVAYAVSAALPDSDDANKVDLTVAALPPDSTPKITVTTVKDLAGNLIGTDAADSEFTGTKDQIAPTLTKIAIDTKLAVATTAVKTEVTVDERLNSTDKGIIFTIAGPTVSTANKSSKLGTLSVVSTDQFNLESTLTVPATPATGIYGVSIQVLDASSDLNDTDNLTDETGETPTINVTTNVLTLANGPIGDKNFDGVVDKLDITVRIATSTAFTATTTNVVLGAVDASARTVVVTSAVATGNVISVDYAWVPLNDVFEIDVTEPTLIAQPKAVLTSQTPLLRVEFSDDDGYPGDTHLTVALTALTLTDPAGAAVTTAFTTTDSKEWIWEPGTDLALGDYKLAYTITDDAGNAKSDTLEFEIKKRTTDIVLKPGWNLISLPDDPLKNGINDVFNTSTAVENVVTYDRKIRTFFLATRQADGTLGRPGSDRELTTIDGSTAYWVELSGVKDLTITVEVPGVQPGAQILPRSFKLAAGWNMVPYATSDLGVGTIDADDYFTGLKWSRAIKFNNDTGQYVSILPSTDNNDLETGNGYWVFLQEAGELTPP